MPFTFMANWRSLPVYELISYVFMFASIPLFAYGTQPYTFEFLRIVTFTIITLYSGFFAALIWNDITDRDIDIIAHPDRPLPRGKISLSFFFLIALCLSGVTFIFAYLISLYCFFLVGAAAVFVAIHNKYLKRHVTLPAYSEIFNPFQWIVVTIFGFIAIWTTFPPSSHISITFPVFGSISTNNTEIIHLVILVLFTYFADNAHDIAEGIHDAEADDKYGVRTYATTVGIKKAAHISLITYVISGFFALILFLLSPLSPLFLCLFLALFIIILRYPLRLIKSHPHNLKKQGLLVGRKLYDYFLFTHVIIFIDITLTNFL
jgi:4-hydroxybenzoate polyprenyltransferase